MKKDIPNYANKIRFRYIDGLRYAVDYLCDGEYNNIKNNIEFKYDQPYSYIKVIDAYKFNFLNSRSRKVIKELGKRINDMLLNLGINFTYAEFVSGKDYYQMNYLCDGRSYIICYTKDDIYLLDFYNNHQIIVSSKKNAENISYKLSGNKIGEDFKITKETHIEKEKLSDSLYYKLLKDKNITTYKIFDNEEMLEVVVCNKDIKDEKELVSIIKNLTLNKYTIEYIFKKLKNSVSLQKGKKQYLSVKKQGKDRLVDKISIIDNDIYVSKYINEDIKYEFKADMNKGLCSYEYFDIENKDRVIRDKGEMKVYANRNQYEMVDLSKKVSDDINSQYQKVLTYIKK